MCRPTGGATADTSRLEKKNYCRKQYQLHNMTISVFLCL